MGFDGKIENQDKRSLGLIGMRERSSSVGRGFSTQGQARGGDQDTYRNSST